MATTIPELRFSIGLIEAPSSAPTIGERCMIPYANPILDSDFPDPDVTRFGGRS